MGYASTINFTFDTICPFTYLAKKRLDRALDQLTEVDNASGTTFRYHFHPYVLHDEQPEQGQDKYQWYLATMHGGDEQRMQKYMALMGAWGVGAGIDFKFGGTIASTLPAHRVIQAVQEAYGPETTNKLVMALYRKYFEEEQHPSSNETLLAACGEAGVPEQQAKELVEDEHEGLAEVKMLIREQKGNGVDAVPVVTLEGRKRDLTIEGAKEVEEFSRALKQICSEAA